MNVRHMTLEQYRTNVIPTVVELKKVLRKKFLITAGWYGLEHLTKDEYIQREILKGRKSSEINNYRLGDSYYEEQAIERWNHHKYKNTEIPTELYNEYTNLYNKLVPLFIDPKKVELSKIHKDHKSEVRRAISDDVYIKELKEGTIDFTLVQNVCDSLGIKVPKRLYDLKEKVEQGLYNRGYLKANKEFLQSIRTYLTPYSDKLKKIKRGQLDAAMEAFEATDYIDVWSYCSKKLDRDMSIYNEINRLYKGNVRVADAEVKIQSLCKAYADQYITSFIFRMEDKTNLVNVKWGVPTITFESGRFSGGEFVSAFTLTYSNGNVITGDSKVIIAGGYIQCLHQRYLFHFYYKGKKVSLEQIDNLN
jgi:hypothetical protein